MRGAYFLDFCVRTLPASVRVAAEVRPSFNALAAVVAVVIVDCLVVCTWAKALPAKDLAVLLAPASRRTVEASNRTAHAWT